MVALREIPTLELERELAAGGYDLIVGFDEVGRGALAGPVMVGAAAIWAADLPHLDVPHGVADSKMLTEHRRETLFDPLRQWCAASAVGQASNAEIDEWGITHALGIAALRALNDVERGLGIDPSGHVSRLNQREPLSGATEPGTMGQPSRWEQPDKSEEVRSEGHLKRSDEPEEIEPVSLLRRSDNLEDPAELGKSGHGKQSGRLVRVGAILDGPSDYITKAVTTFDAPAVPVPAHVVTKVKGDRHCATVAAAAVIAKVTRDRLMVDIAQGNPRYAPYDWAHNKGYGSKQHREAIVEHGPTPLHRMSWHLIGD